MAAGKMTVLTRDWMPPEDVIKLLGKSDRTIQRLAVAGHLRWKVENGTRRRVYHAGDVERVKDEGIQAGRQEPQRRALAAPSSALMRLPFQPAPIGIREKLWLTLEEASELSNLAKAYLLRAVNEGKLTAVKAPGWRIRRASLEAFAG